MLASSVLGFVLGFKDLEIKHVACLGTLEYALVSANGDTRLPECYVLALLSLYLNPRGSPLLKIGADMR